MREIVYALAASANYFASTGREEQIIERGDFEPLRTPRIVSGMQFSVDYCAIKVDQHVMILARPGFIGHNAFEDRGD